MIRLDVWLTLPSGESVKTGALVVAAPDDIRGALQGQFRYNSEYLEHPRAFPLDPLHLPLSTGNFEADRPHAGVHGVFEDSLPDDWGRRLMIRCHKLGRGDQRIPNLLQLLGNLGFRCLELCGKRSAGNENNRGFQPSPTGTGPVSGKIRTGTRCYGRR